jgi:hypothetical protein
MLAADAVRERRDATDAGRGFFLPGMHTWAHMLRWAGNMDVHPRFGVSTMPGVHHY